MLCIAYSLREFFEVTTELSFSIILIFGTIYNTVKIIVLSLRFACCC